MCQESEVPQEIVVSQDVCDPERMTEMGVEICRAIQAVKAEILPNREIQCPEDFARGWCRHIATEVYQALGEPDDVRIMRGGTMGGHHLWIKHNGRHFDAERPCGVDEYQELPFVRRLGSLLGEPKDKTEEVMYAVRHSA